VQVEQQLVPQSQQSWPWHQCFMRLHMLSLSQQPQLVEQEEQVLQDEHDEWCDRWNQLWQPWSQESQE